MIHSLFSREARRTTKGGSFRPTGDFFDLHGEHVARYVWAGQFLKNLRVLDAGCGHGYGSDYLAKRIATHVLGIDSDPSAISFALCNYTRHNLDFRVMDVTKILFPPESFDAIVSFEVIEHLSNVDNYLEGIYKTLKHGGVFIMSTPNREYTAHFYQHGMSTLSLHHKREFYANELQDLLRRHFNLMETYGERHEGSFDKHMLDYYRYSSSCAIPPVLRKVFPRQVRSMWLRMKGSSAAPDLRGKWKDFQIIRVNNVSELDDRFPCQLYVCTK